MIERTQQAFADIYTSLKFKFTYQATSAYASESEIFIDKQIACVNSNFCFSICRIKFGSLIEL